MRYFFITGTSRGIGKALVERILQEDDTEVHGFSRHGSVEHQRYFHHQADLSDTEWLAGHVNGFFPSLQDADQIVLVNNAGTLGEVKYLGELQNSSIAHLFNLNVTAVAVLMNQFMKAYHHHHTTEKLMINVSSGAGKSPVDGWSGYCASKSALDMLSKVAQLELQQKGRSQQFKVYALAPGVVDTEMQGEIRQSSRENFSKLDKFIDYKKEGALDDARYTAEKFMELINDSQKFTEVLQDVRQY